MKDYIDGREMTPVIQGVQSEWRRVASGVSQRSMLIRIMFLVYVNDVSQPQGISGYMFMYR